MLSDPNLVFYACITKGATILAEFSREASNEALAQQCVELAPPHHAIFSHTLRNKTFMFLIDHPFAYFAILHENLQKSESFWLLNRLKTVFEELILSHSISVSDKFTSLCFQGEIYPLFREIMALDLDLVDPLMEEPKESRASSVDSTKGKGNNVARPLLGKPTKLLRKKKQRFFGDQANGDHQAKDDTLGVGEKGNVVLSRDFSVSMVQKIGGFYMGGDSRQKAKQVWRKHVWLVLVLDLVVCAVLFGVWLWVCRGFKCIDG